MKKFLITPLFILALSLTAHAGGWTMTPSGGYVGGDSWTMTPSGGYVGGDSWTMAPDGSYCGYSLCN